MAYSRARRLSQLLGSDGTVPAGKIPADAIDGTKIADNAINSEHYTDGSIDTAHIAADQITNALIPDNAINSEHYTDGSIDTAHIAADQITSALIADDQIDSEHIVDGSIDTAHIAASQITNALMADDAIDSAEIANGAIDLAHMSVNSIDSDQYVDGSVDNVHLANSSVTVSDGSNTSPIALGGTLTFAGTANEIDVVENAGTITYGLPNNVTISGNLTVSGDTTTVNTSTLAVEDPLIALATGNNAADAVDIGLYGLYDTSGSQDLYGGLFRDASDSGKWKLFKSLQAAPTTTVNTSGTGYAVDTLVANLEGNVTGNVTGNTSGTAGTAGTAATVTTAAQPAITSVGTLTSLNVDSLTLNGTSLTSSGNLTIDVASDIYLDADGGDIDFRDGGATFGRITNSSLDLVISSVQDNEDILFKGVDGGSPITALTLDMSEAGAATFNAGVSASTLTSAGAINVTNGNSTFVTGSSWGTGLELRNVNDDVSPAILRLQKTPSSGGSAVADSDYIGGIVVRGLNDAGENHNYVEMWGLATDVSNGSESSRWGVGTWASGTEHPYTLMANAGKVGIGVSGPTALLDVRGSGTGNQRMHLISTGLSNGNDVDIVFGRDNGNNLSGRLGYYYNTTQSARYLYLKHFGDTHGLIIKDGGKVGIGTTSPAGPLHVDGHTGSLATILEGNGNGDTVPLHFRVKANNNNVTNHGIFGNAGSTGAGNFIQIGASNTSGISVMSDGNVGIGTVSPTSSLDVRSGSITVGTASETSGTVMLQNFYTGDHHLGIQGTLSSSGGMYWGYGVKQEGSGAWKSTYSNFSGTRTSYYLDNDSAVWAYSASQNTAIDGTVTMTDKIKFDLTNGYVGIGTTSPGAKLEISGKDDAGISDLLRLQFDNSPADTGITFTDINSTVKNRITMDAANTNDLRISSGTQMHFYGGTSNGTGAGHLTVKSSGVINMPLQAIMLRTLASGQTISTSTSTTINWDTNETTTDITYSSGEFTVPTAGVYLINTYARFQSTATGHNTFLSLHHRASGGSFTEKAYDYVASCRAYHQMNINRAVECAAGDIMKVVVWHNQGGNLDLTGNSSSCAISVTKVV